MKTLRCSWPRGARQQTGLLGLTEEEYSWRLWSKMKIEEQIFNLWVENLKPSYYNMEKHWNKYMDSEEAKAKSGHLDKEL